MIYQGMMAILMMPLEKWWVTNFLTKTTTMLMDRDGDDDNDYDERC